MKFNSVKFLIITSLIIIILYTLGLFLPIIKNTKQSKTQYYFEIKVVYILGLFIPIIKNSKNSKMKDFYTVKFMV